MIIILCGGHLDFHDLKSNLDICTRSASVLASSNVQDRLSPRGFQTLSTSSEINGLYSKHEVYFQYQNFIRHLCVGADSL